MTGGGFFVTFWWNFLALRGSVSKKSFDLFTLLYSLNKKNKKKYFERKRMIFLFFQNKDLELCI